MLAGKVRMSVKPTVIFGTNTLALASPGLHMPALGQRRRRQTLVSVEAPVDVGQTSLRARPQQLIERTAPPPPRLPANELRLLIDLLCLSLPCHQFISPGTSCELDSVKTANLRHIFPLDIPISFRVIFPPFFTSSPASPRQS